MKAWLFGQNGCFGSITIFTFHDSTFECVAHSFDCTVENVGLDEEHARTLESFRSQKRHGKPWLGLS